MKTNKITLLLFSLLCIIINIHAQEESSDKWWPHKIWGEHDEIGASNWITSEKVLEALTVVRHGKIYELGFMYENGMSVLGQREYELSIPGTGGPWGEFNMLSHGEKLVASIGQVGTQFDAIGHIGQAISVNGDEKKVFYNGFEVEDVYDSNGLKTLGIEHVKPIITKGILIDVAAFRGISTIADNYIITLDEIKGALKKQGIEESSIRDGDALFFNFGWWRNYGKENYVSFNLPGLDQSVVEWIIEKNAVMIGSDTYADPSGKWGVHLDLLMKNGIYNLEFMTFEGLLEDEIYEFLFIVAPIRFKGATGSPVRPIAIH